MKEFMYYVNGLYFANLKTARKHAQRVGDSDILLTLGDYDETILAYHPMSERLERIELSQRKTYWFFGARFAMND